MTWAELHRQDDGLPVLVNPRAVLLAWENIGGSVTLCLSTGERIDVVEEYRVVSSRLHTAAQAEVAA